VSGYVAVGIGLPVLVAGFIVIVLRGRLSWCLSSLAACSVVVVRLVEMSGWELWLKPPAAISIEAYLFPLSSPSLPVCLACSLWRYLCVKRSCAG